MNVKFDKAHVVAYGKEFENQRHDCAYRAWDQGSGPLNLSQVQICLTGSPEFILQKLQKIVSEMQYDANAANLNKPSECSIVTRTHYVADVIVPVWHGKISDEVDIKELDQYKEVEDD